MTTPFFVRFVKIINTLKVLTVGILCSSAIHTSLAATAQVVTPEVDDPVVGHVTLFLGKAFIESDNRARERVRVGMPIHVHDRIQTASNGHVHLHFVDKALVSVRPGSELEVLRYDFDELRPEQSTVKFDLQEGVVRAISGRAAKSARERFRLNTPIAAIGVRGTDFVVSATEQTVRALVNVGRIVVAPYSAECLEDAFGPCASNAVELTENTLQIIELEQGSPLPMLLPAPDERNLGSVDEQVQLASSDSNQDNSGDADNKTVGTKIYLENVTSTRVTADAAKAAQTQSLPDFMPESPAGLAQLEQKQMIWGRWADGLGDKERITGTYAAIHSERSVTVGNADYGLFRPENGSIVMNKGLGVVSFSLGSAQAFYTNAQGTSAMRVAGGNLNIDFDHSRFATNLNLDHSATGNLIFAADGRIDEAGYFNTRGVDQRMAGAVSIDGTEAGYFFEKQLLNGGIQGLTLWDSQ